MRKPGRVKSPSLWNLMNSSLFVDVKSDGRDVPQYLSNLKNHKFRVTYIIMHIHNLLPNKGRGFITAISYLNVVPPEIKYASYFRLFVNLLFEY